MLRKVQATLDDCGVKDGAVIIVEIVDKIPSSSNPRPRRPVKEEPKVPVSYGIRNNSNPENDG